MKKKNHPGLLLILTGVLMQSCMEVKKKESFYETEDFARVKKYDSHVHINTFDPVLINYARSQNFYLLSLNVAAPDYVPLHEQQGFTTFHQERFPGAFNYVTSFNIEGIGEPGWQEKTIAYLDQSFKQGALGVKVWKNIGMEYKDKDDKFVMIDDPRLDPVLDFITENNKTLVGHLGEPKNCWLPLEEMTVKNDREYFKKHPEYHMYLHPEYPSYEDQVNARDNMLKKHPEMRFVGAHLASLEWDVDEIAARLDKYPNMAVDMAERVSHLQFQAQKDHQKVYDFFVRYQDRLLYSTDIVIDSSMDSSAVLKYAHDTWTEHWKFFTSDEEMTASEVEGPFRGLHLPATVIDKLYRENAEKWFPGLGQK